MYKLAKAHQAGASADEIRIEIPRTLWNPDAAFAIERIGALGEPASLALVLACAANDADI